MNHPLLLPLPVTKVVIMFVKEQIDDLQSAITKRTNDLKSNSFQAAVKRNG